ncbi:MAG: NTP transferase domain-containing protein [Myxococcota bacterium]
MQLVIPMAGFGERFRREGYAVPKPMIPVMGRPMVAWVIDLFPFVDEVLLICNDAHLGSTAYDMAGTLKTHCPTARVVSVPAHREGPVRTVVDAADHLHVDGEIIVSVCDLNFIWNHAAFREHLETEHPEGTILTYRGWHPHFLNSTHYGFVQETDGWVSRVREKGHFTDDPVANEEPCSNGVYYFKSGRKMLDEMRQLQLRPEERINGELYISQVYGLLLEEGCRISAFDHPYYFQWGTPHDLEVWQHHAESLASRVQPRPRTPSRRGTLLIPMAGLGSRFANEGWTTPKPLIPVCGAPMVVQAARDLPAFEHTIFVLRRDMPDAEAMARVLQAWFPGSVLVWLDGPTDGQATTVVLGLQQGEADPEAPVVIGCCDNGVLHDEHAHEAWLDDASRSSALIWTMAGHPGAALRPHHFSWVSCDDNGRVQGVSVKQPLGSPRSDPMVIGTFSFRRAGDVLEAYARLTERGARVGGELYMDALIDDHRALGGTVSCHQVDHYDGWGTPDELRSFQYWQSALDAWPAHDYAMARDPRVVHASSPLHEAHTP